MDALETVLPHQRHVARLGRRQTPRKKRRDCIAANCVDTMSAYVPLGSMATMREVDGLLGMFFPRLARGGWARGMAGGYGRSWDDAPERIRSRGVVGGITAMQRSPPGFWTKGRVKY